MSDALPLVLAAALILLALGLFATLLQIRRTARKFEAFLDTAQRNLESITHDVRELRLYCGQLVTPLHSAVQEVAGIARVAGEMAQSLRRTQRRLGEALGAGGSRLRTWIRGFAGLLGFLKH